ncbi:hypothetical protein A6B43_06935 [Vespertiliibacter pulmonis]|uniref:Putative lipoprotein n=1 Tax=Vespertiliibacter pulmonis TaxID=1443036 RepID=A0A3N4VRF7_9PAST|nr:integrase [Vespertiliibacter pulmonis]QLB21270.1 hypothetical protein A6B43_06935 [Vespertiliibacter pulmonis]RPE85676.1 putative lipoprotein [Vespertiliibacter pulmonis]
MKKLLAFIFIGSIGLLLTACSGQVITTSSYVPQNYVRVDTSVNIGKFSYVPETLGIAKSNQIENTAIGSFIIDTPIAELAKKTTALELHHSGVDLGNGKITLEGKVKKFKVDDIGINVDWLYQINYKILKSKDNSVLLDKDYTATMRTSKFIASLSEVSAFINKILSLGFDKFINDYDARKAFEQK